MIYRVHVNDRDRSVPLGFTYFCFTSSQLEDCIPYRLQAKPLLGPRLVAVGEPRLALQPSLRLETDVRQQSARTRNQNIKELTRLYPEIVPAQSLLAPLTQVSEAIIDITTKHDPQVSDRIAYGTASRLVKNFPSNRTIPITVVAGGVAGERVRFLQPKRQMLRWPEYKSIGLLSSTLEGAEEVWWSGNGSPIQQLCFSSIEDISGGWLAARYHGATTIFRPLYHQEPVASSRTAKGYHPNTVCPPSRINPNPIISLDIQATGGAPHVDVSFNPWYERQLAIIDTQGYWSIWDIEGQHGRTWTAKPGHGGHLSDGLAEGEERSSSLNPDGWGMVLFVSNVSTLIIVGRRSLAIINVGSNKHRLEAPDIGLTKGADWILDIKRSPVESNQVFVVTSACIFWIEVRSQNDSGNSDQTVSGAVILLAWLHFRNKEDISLRMEVVSHDEGTPTTFAMPMFLANQGIVILAALYSRLDKLCTVFNVKKDDSACIPISVSDPYQLPLIFMHESPSELDKDGDNTQSRLHVSALTLRALKYATSSNSQPSGPGKVYLDENVGFYQLSILYNDLSVRDSIYFRAPSRELLQVSAPMVKTVPKALRVGPKYVDDDFVVPDGLVSDDVQDKNIRQRFTWRSRSFRRPAKATEGQSDPWTLDFSWLQKSFQIDGTPAASSYSKLKDAPSGSCLKDALEKLSLKIRDSSTLDNATIKTVYVFLLFSITIVKPNLRHRLESLDITLFSENVDIASASFKEWLESTNLVHPKLENMDDDDAHSIRSPLFMTNVLSKMLFGFHAMEENQLLLDMYEKLIESWISPLSSEVPNRVRVQMEKTIRGIAIQLFLANHVLQPSPYAAPEEPEKTVEDLSPDFNNPLNLPVRAKQAASHSSSKGRRAALSPSPQPSSQLSENAGFTTPYYPVHRTVPPHSPTPPLSSQNSTASTTEPFNPASLRLRAITTLTPQPPLPASLSNFLNHWTTGTDPSTYDWAATQAVLGGLSETEGTESDATIKRKLRREKRRKRWRGDIVESSSQPMVGQVSSQAETAGSSQVTESAMSLSQVGVRRSQLNIAGKGKKKKAKRVPGF